MHFFLPSVIKLEMEGYRGTQSNLSGMFLNLHDLKETSMEKFIYSIVFLTSLGSMKISVKIFFVPARTQKLKIILLRTIQDFISFLKHLLQYLSHYVCLNQNIHQILITRSIFLFVLHLLLFPPRGGSIQALSSEYKIIHVDFTDTMSFLPSKLMQETIPNSNACSINTSSL